MFNFGSRKNLCEIFLTERKMPEKMQTKFPISEAFMDHI